jgi:DNA-binding beta-propeller fold protein YncE
MKNLSLTIALVGLSCVCNSIAGVTIKTESGKVFQDAEFQKMESGQVSIRHAGGVARIPLEDFSESARKALHIPQSLGLLKLDLEKILAEAQTPVEQLNSQYRGYLEQQEAEAKRAGNLEKVLVLREELKQFAGRGKVDYQAFPELEKKRQVYGEQLQKRCDIAVGVLKSQLGGYQKALQEFEMDLTKSGNLEEAVKAREERERIGKLTGEGKALLGLVAFSDMPGESPAGKVGSLDGYFALVASMTSEAIASVNLDSGEVKVLHQFKEKTGPRGIAVDPAGTLYVGLRYGGMNVIQMTPKVEGGFEVKDHSGRVGPFGAGKLRISSKGELLITGDATGSIFRFDLKAGKPNGAVGPDNMGNAVGLDATGDEVYVVEVFGGRIAKLQLRNSSAKETWLTKQLEPSLKRSTGIAVGHNGNLFVTNTESSVIPEFSQKTGEFVGAFFDLKEIGASAANEIRYVPSLKSYFVMSEGNILQLDLNGKLVRKYPLTPAISGGQAVEVVNKAQVAKVLADQL